MYLTSHFAYFNQNPITAVFLTKLKSQGLKLTLSASLPIKLLTKTGLSTSELINIIDKCPVTLDHGQNCNFENAGNHKSNIPMGKFFRFFKLCFNLNMICCL